MGKAKRLTANALALASNDALLIERVNESYELYNQALRQARERFGIMNNDAALAHASRVNDAINGHARAIETLTGQDDTEEHDD